MITNNLCKGCAADAKQYSCLMIYGGFFKECPCKECLIKVTCSPTRNVCNEFLLLWRTAYQKQMKFKNVVILTGQNS
jgi:hypothetical protein